MDLRPTENGNFGAENVKCFVALVGVVLQSHSFTYFGHNAVKIGLTLDTSTKFLNIRKEGFINHKLLCSCGEGVHDEMRL